MASRYTYNIKFVNAQQAKLVYNYKNIKDQMYVYLDAIDTCDALMRPLRMAT
jgi:hypothetical protein